MTSIRRKRSNRSRKRKSIRKRSVRRRSVKRRSIRRKLSNRSNRSRKKRKSIRRRSVRRRSMKGGALNTLGKGTAISAGALAIGITGKKIYDLKQENKRLQKKEEELKEENTTALQKKEEELKEENTTALQKKEEEHARFLRVRNKLLQMKIEEEKIKRKHPDLMIYETEMLNDKKKAKVIFTLATGDEKGVIHFDDFKDCIRFSDTDEIHAYEIDFLKEIFDESEGGNIYETEMSIEEFVNFILREDFEIDLDDMIECLKQKHK